jgi:hypothetical protein
MKGGCGIFDGVGAGHHPVESGGAQLAGHSYLTAELVGASDTAANNGAQPGGIHESDRRQVDDEAPGGCHVGQGLAELTDRNGV